MGAEEKTPANGVASVAAPEAVAEGGAPPPVPPPEEPPKLEEIVTDDVLQQIIKGYNPELSLVSWQAQPGSNIGDNYMSIMYSVELVLEDKKRNGAQEKLQVMLKTIPRNIYRAEMINEMKAFQKEALVYQQVFPVFIQTQEEKQIFKEDVFSAWPTCYAAHIDGRTDFLAMENLKDAGYVMASRKLGLDFNHCAIVLRSMAKYHAISYAKYGGNRDKILEDFPILKNSMFNKESKTNDMQQQFFSQSFKTQAESLRNLGHELAASRMEKLAEVNCADVLGDLLSRDINCAVILHGDCWVNNMLFKYGEKDGKPSSCPVHVKFIDFQLSSAASRVVDLFYFLMTSGKHEVVNEREQDLLMIYYSEFTSYAQKLGADTKAAGLTWDAFLKEVDEYRLYGVFMGLLLAPMMTADSADIPDMESFTAEEFENSDETVKKFYQGMDKGDSRVKVMNIVLNQLPKCANGQQYL